MTLVDGEGRLFGRVNLVDALAAAFVIILLPAAYASWLLLRPATPRIDSVERSEVTWAEERIAAGAPIRLKVKVRGANLTPMLRATIGTVPALGFTFESPASGDVIIGENVPLGTHDLVLYDGAQEVARARDAIAILPQPGAIVRAFGAFTGLDEARARALREGETFTVERGETARILRLGEVGDDRRPVEAGAARVETSVAGTRRRPAIVLLHCEPAADASVCRVGGQTLGAGSVVVTIPGSEPPLRLTVDEIASDTEPASATARVRASVVPDVAASIRTGDRDARRPLIDESAASVLSVQRSGDGVVITLRLGVERAAGGWRYHGQAVEPGRPLSLVTDRYGLTATVEEFAIDGR